MFQEWIFGYRTIGLMKRLFKSIVRPRKTWNEMKHRSSKKIDPMANHKPIMMISNSCSVVDVVGISSCEVVED